MIWFVVKKVFIKFVSLYIVKGNIYFCVIVNVIINGIIVIVIDRFIRVKFIIRMVVVVWRFLVCWMVIIIRVFLKMVNIIV